MISLKIYRTIILLLLILFVQKLILAQNDTLRISIDGFNSSDSKAIITIHDNEKSFPSNVSKAFRKYEVKIINKKVKVTITDLPHGRYALVVCHDENKDNKLNTNFLGFPTEGTAIFNKNRGMPNFRKSCFNFPEIKEANLTIKYF